MLTLCSAMKTSDAPDEQVCCPGKTCPARVTWTFDLDLGHARANVSNGMSTHDGEQVCKFILKSIQNCRRYGPDKSFTFKCDLDPRPT